MRRECAVQNQATKKREAVCLSLRFVFANVNIVYQKSGQMSSHKGITINETLLISTS